MMAFESLDWLFVVAACFALAAQGFDNIVRFLQAMLVDRRLFKAFLEAFKAVGAGFVIWQLVRIGRLAWALAP